ncbi:hypothetical protein B0H10DRAFT_483987 [Mycena sp. CBHHK59/15]|nr:hypothetical protein B0H10DRAFT_483987 [Mycena sp. CBHHK59/15]
MIYTIETRVSNAVHDFISSASLVLRFPPVSNSTWETTLAHTQQELSAMRSHGLLALYSCLAQALIGAIERRDFLHDLKPLCECILSDEVLTRILVRAGVNDSYIYAEQGGTAFLVFVAMVIMDRGAHEIVSWFSQTFDPLVSVACAACDAW